MSIEQDAILALARQQQLAGSLGAKGNVTSADIKNLLSPELGYLTGTFYGQQGTGEEDDELFWMDYAPNFRKALTLPDTDIRKIIAGEIYRGAAPWDVKRQIEEYTASQADLSPGLINQEGETKDLQSFANTVFTEYNNYQVAKTKAARKSAGEDPFVAGGVPYPDMDFAPQYLAPDLFENLAKEAAARNAESNKFSQRAKSRSSALEFLGQQKRQDTKRAEEQQTPYAFDEKSEGLRSSLSRNLANTPMGRGEAGLTGLFPLLKMVEQIPAGAAALYRGITDPIYEEGVRNVNYIAKNTIGKSLEDVSLGNDPIGQILYGRDRKGSKPKDDGSFQRAEDARFGRTAQSVVDRSANVSKDIQESGKKEKWLQDFTSALGMLVQAKARSAGYTPYQETMTARSNFLRAGGM
jgi:hypothetical protein